VGPTEAILRPKDEFSRGVICHTAPMVRFALMNPKAPVLDLFIGRDHDA
jgi:hypothetical protein